MQYNIVHYIMAQCSTIYSTYLDLQHGSNVNKIAYTAKDPRPPTVFSVPNRNKKLEVGRRRREEEKVSLKTHATARGVGKNMTEGREEGKEEDQLGSWGFDCNWVQMSRM